MHEQVSYKKRGRPVTTGRTSKTVRIPKDWDVSELIGIYILIHSARDGRQMELEAGISGCTRNWVEFDRLMDRVDACLQMKDCD